MGRADNEAWAQIVLDLYPDDSESSDCPEQTQWSNAGLDDFVGRFFAESLHELLDGRSSEETRQEIRAWVSTRFQHPLAFDVCCLFLGYDPERMREAIEQQEAVRERAVRLRQRQRHEANAA